MQVATSAKVRGHAAANGIAAFSGGPSVCTQGSMSPQSGGMRRSLDTGPVPSPTPID